jgi:hypothetical protein
VVETRRQSDETQAIVNKASQEWMAGTGAASKGEPTAADKVGAGKPDLGIVDNFIRGYAGSRFS